MSIEEWIGISTVLGTMIISIVTLTIKGTRLLSKVENRIENLEDSMSKVHDGCHIPVKAMSKVESDIKDLQDKDKDIAIQLTDMNNTLTQTHTMTTAMYNHFFEEGIKNGRRSDD